MEETAAMVVIRKSFEAWITSPPYERSVQRLGDDTGFPDCYEDYGVHLAWDAWRAGGRELAKHLDGVACRYMELQRLVAAARNKLRGCEPGLYEVGDAFDVLNAAVAFAAEHQPKEAT